MFNPGLEYVFHLFRAEEDGFRPLTYEQFVKLVSAIRAEDGLS